MSKKSKKVSGKRILFWCVVLGIGLVGSHFDDSPAHVEQATYPPEVQKLVDKFGPPPERTGSHNRYIPVEIYLEHVMNDPTSLEMVGCGEVRHTKQGWLVSCSYRGKNAFGAMILTANWFTIRNGAVVNMESWGTYKL